MSICFTVNSQELQVSPPLSATISGRIYDYPKQTYAQRSVNSFMGLGFGFCLSLSLPIPQKENHKVD